MRFLNLIDVWIYRNRLDKNCLSFDSLFVSAKLSVFSQFELKKLGQIKTLKNVIRIYKTL
jgi:hypothetical protein